MKDEWVEDPNSGDLVHKPTGRRISKQQRDDIEISRRRGLGVPIDIEDLKRTIASDPGPTSPKATTLKVEIKVQDKDVILVRRIEANVHRTPNPLKAGDREKETLQEYKTLRELAESSGGQTEFDVPRLVHVRVKRFEGSPTTIEAGEIISPAVNLFEFVRPGGFMTAGGVPFEELASQGPGDHYFLRRW